MQAYEGPTKGGLCTPIDMHFAAGSEGPCGLIVSIEESTKDISSVISGDQLIIEKNGGLITSLNQLGNEFTLELTTTYKNQTVHCYRRAVLSENRKYIVTGFAPASKWSDVKNELIRSIKSFEVINTKSPDKPGFLNFQNLQFRIKPMQGVIKLNSFGSYYSDDKNENITSVAVTLLDAPRGASVNDVELSFNATVRPNVTRVVKSSVRHNEYFAEYEWIRNEKPSRNYERLILQNNQIFKVNANTPAEQWPKNSPSLQACIDSFAGSVK